MDVLDPLGTIDAIAPHSTSFSSNIYLLKREHKVINKGDLLAISTPFTPTAEEKLHFTVGLEISPANYTHPYSATSLCRIFGFKTSQLDGKIVLNAKEGSVAFGRIYVVQKDLEVGGEKIGEHDKCEVWANVMPEGSREDVDGVWKVMVDEFGESIELAYYWYLETGTFYGRISESNAGEDEIKILGDLDIGSLINDSVSK